MVQRVGFESREIMNRLAKLEMDINFIRNKIDSFDDDKFKSELKELERSEREIIELGEELG